MGFFKKITRPISRVLDKIIPNEIKPALPYLSAAAPFFGPTSAFMGTGIRRLALGGGFNLASQLAQEGNDAETLLNSTAFSGVVNGLLESTFEKFCMSENGEESLREDTYQGYRALVSLVDTLKGKVAVRDQINERASESRSEEE